MGFEHRYERRTPTSAIGAVVDKFSFNRTRSGERRKRFFRDFSLNYGQSVYGATEVLVAALQSGDSEVSGLDVAEEWFEVVAGLVDRDLRSTLSRASVDQRMNIPLLQSEYLLNELQNLDARPAALKAAASFALWLMSGDFLAHNQTINGLVTKSGDRPSKVRERVERKKTQMVTRLSANDKTRAHLAKAAGDILTREPQIQNRELVEPEAEKVLETMLFYLMSLDRGGRIAREIETRIRYSREPLFQKANKENEGSLASKMFFDLVISHPEAAGLVAHFLGGTDVAKTIEKSITRKPGLDTNDPIASFASFGLLTSGMGDQFKDRVGAAEEIKSWMIGVINRLAKEGYHASASGIPSFSKTEPLMISEGGQEIPGAVRQALEFIASQHAELSRDVAGDPKLILFNLAILMAYGIDSTVEGRPKDAKTTEQIAKTISRTLINQWRESVTVPPRRSSSTQIDKLLPLSYFWDTQTKTQLLGDFVTETGHIPHLPSKGLWRKVCYALGFTSIRTADGSGNVDLDIKGEISEKTLDLLGDFETNSGNGFRSIAQIIARTNHPEDLQEILDYLQVLSTFSDETQAQKAIETLNESMKTEMMRILLLSAPPAIASHIERMSKISSSAVTQLKTQLEAALKEVGEIPEINTSEIEQDEQKSEFGAAINALKTQLLNQIEKLTENVDATKSVEGVVAALIPQSTQETATPEGPSIADVIANLFGKLVGKDGQRLTTVQLVEAMNTAGLLKGMQAQEIAVESIVNFKTDLENMVSEQHKPMIEKLSNIAFVEFGNQVESVFRLHQTVYHLHEKYEQAIADTKAKMAELDAGHRKAVVEWLSTALQLNVKPEFDWARDIVSQKELKPDSNVHDCRLSAINTLRDTNFAGKHLGDFSGFAEIPSLDDMLAALGLSETYATK